jgi:hypothetical protein
MVPSRMRAIAAFAAACAMALVLAPQAVFAQRDLGVESYQVRGVQVELTSVARNPDGSIMVKWAYHNTTTRPQTIAEAGCYLEANGAKYPAMSLGGGNMGAMETTHMGTTNIVLNAHQTYVAWAKVKSPGKSVSKVTVYITGTSPFTDITVT